MKPITEYPCYKELKTAPSPFVILVGPEGSGKKLLAKTLVQQHNKERKDNMQCVEMEGTKENIESLAQANALGGGVKAVVVVHDYTEMTKPALNAMLKVTEETPAGLKIILCSRTLNVMLTLASRASIVQMDLPSKSDIIEYALAEMQEQQAQECRYQVTDAELANLAHETFHMCETIGQVKKLDKMERGVEKDRADTLELFNKALAYLPKCTLSNALKLIDALIDTKNTAPAYNFVPCFGRYGVWTIADSESLSTYPLPYLQMLMEAFSVNTADKAYAWVTRYKARLELATA